MTAITPTAFETILYVRDLDAARGFYADILGLSVFYESDFYLSFQIGEGAFLSCNGRRETYKACGTGEKGVIVEFRVADVDATHRRLVAMGIPFEFPPEDKPWGLRSCCMRDPEGYPVWISTLLGPRDG
jgi:catechol 2,3-dioxygenase-like lactoylglutathione lyase family enzyme